MEISKRNANGVLSVSHTEIAAKRGRSYATVKIAICQDGKFRYAVDMMYSYGGFSGPIRDDAEAYNSIEAAKSAGMEELLQRWPKPFASEPQSVHEELRLLREEVESQLRQPSLF